MISMKKNNKIKSLVIVGCLIIWAFSMIKIGASFASTDKLSLTNVEIVNKTVTTDVGSLTYENQTITNDITFHHVGDYVSYQITMKNNDDKKYTIKSITDDNTNEYIKYRYDNYAGTVIEAHQELKFRFEVKYQTEMMDISKRAQSFDVKFTFELDDENGNSTSEDITVNPSDGTSNQGSMADSSGKNPSASIKGESTNNTSSGAKTGDRIGLYVGITAVSGAMLVAIVTKKKHKKSTKILSLFIIATLVVPATVRASAVGINVSIKNSFKLHDKLVINTMVDGESVQQIINYGETLPVPETPEKPGYTFIGWFLADGTAYDFDAPITGDVSIEPHYRIINYDISYELNGGLVSANNQMQYTVEDEITLNNPQKNGYEFAGWTGTGLQGKVKNVTIERGSTGDRAYVANYDLVNYAISYDGINENERAQLRNPEEYNIESDEITLRNPQDRTNTEGDVIERFIGWKIGNTTAIDTKILAGSTGVKDFTAIWQEVVPDEYSIRYTLDGGVLSTENPTTYTNRTVTFTLNNPTKTGYTFDGWTGSNGTTPQTEVTIPKGTTGDLNYTANYTAVEYTVIYDNNIEGENHATHESQHTYDIEKALDVNAFTRTGYDFAGWNTEADGSGVAYTDEQEVKNLVASGSITLYAQWNAHTYVVEFKANGGDGTTMANQEFSYDEELALSINTYTKADEVFIGWNTEANGDGTYYSDEQLVMNLTDIDGEHISLYAMWKKLKVGDYVNYDPTSSFGDGLEYGNENLPEGVSISANFSSGNITKWRVLNISNGEVQLVAEQPTEQTVSLTAMNGYINGVQVLDSIASIYGYGTGAVEARSIKLEDIEHYSKYDKRTFSNPNSSTGKYGGVRKYTSGNFVVGNEIVTATTSAPQTVTQTTYWYNPSEYAYTEEENPTAAKAYQMLCVDIPVTHGSGDTVYKPYWIADRGQYLNSSAVMYSIHYMGDMHATGVAEKGVRGLISSAGASNGTNTGTQTGSYTATKAILPVVRMHSSVRYTYDVENDSWNINYVPISYNVAFDSNGGEGTMEEQVFSVGEEKTLSANTFTKVGCVFDGWNTAEDGSGSQYTDEQMVKNLSLNSTGVTLYAQWKELHIGDSVDYSTSFNGTTLNNWKVFYKDNNYAYLILGDFMPNSSVDSSLGLSTANTYNVYGANLQTAISTASNWNSLLAGTLNGKSIDYRNSDDENVKAYGGPSLELFAQSWNSCYEDDQIYVSNNDVGYLVGKNENEALSEVTLSETLSQGRGIQINLMRDASNGGVTYGYWLSSKSGTEGGQDLLCAGYHVIYTPGTVSNPQMASINPAVGNSGRNTYQRIGLKPIVCIPLEAF